MNRKDAVSACISEKVDEGYDQDQAVAICLSMEERGELGDLTPATADTGEGMKQSAPASRYEAKDFSFELKGVDAAERVVEGYASTFERDEDGDVIAPGAFSKTLRERGERVKVLWQHFEPIGVPIELREDKHGLYMRARISRTQLGDDALQLAKDGVVDRFSVGFGIPAGKASMIEAEDGGVTRVISEVKLYEVSLVTFPANENAVLTAVKSMRENIRNGREPLYGMHSPADEVRSALRQEPRDSTIDPLEVEALKQSIEEFRNIARKG